MEKEILKVISLILEDRILKVVYANEVNHLFRMLEKEQSGNLVDGTLPGAPTPPFEVIK